MNISAESWSSKLLLATQGGQGQRNDQEDNRSASQSPMNSAECQSNQGADILEESGSKDLESADLLKVVYADLAAVWKHNEWGAILSDDDGNLSLDYKVELITGALDPQVCHLIPNSNALVHRDLIMDGVLDKLPYQESEEEFSIYLKKLNRKLITSRNIFLARSFFQKPLGCNKCDIIITPTKSLLLRLIKMVEDKAVVMERDHLQVPERFNSTMWITEEDWMNAMMGTWENKEKQDDWPYYVTRKDEYTGAEVRIPVYQYRLSFFKAIEFSCHNHKEVTNYDGSMGIQALRVRHHNVVDWTRRPFVHDEAIDPFILPLEPVWVIAMFIFSFQRREVLHPSQKKNDTEWNLLIEILELCHYFMRLVTRVQIFDRPRSIPFQGPANLSNSLLNSGTKSNDSVAEEWAHLTLPAPIFSSSPIVEELMTGTLEASMPTELYDFLSYCSEDEIIEEGKATFEALRRLGVRFQEAAEKYRQIEQVSRNESNFWLLTRDLSELDDRVALLQDRFNKIKGIMINRDLSDAIHMIDPGAEKGLTELFPLPRGLGLVDILRENRFGMMQS
jgi:hypothetical protein